jgi:antibiotic biosynthesis monooxygenase (ABM) superfamily enzyme
MWKFKPGERENMLIFREKLLALKDEIPQIRSAEVGIDISGSDRNFDAVLVADFDTLEDLQTYLENPKHKAVSALCRDIRLERTAVDYEY